MRGTMRTAGILAACLCMALSGCAMVTGKQGQNQELTAPVPSQSQETQAAEPETEKPVLPQQSEIQPFPNAEEDIKEEPLRGGKRIAIMTDIHYLAASLTDKGNGFQEMVDVYKRQAVFRWLR